MNEGCHLKEVTTDDDDDDDSMSVPRRIDRDVAIMRHLAE